MPKNNADLLNEVAEYYSGRHARHGSTSRGVDWNGEQGQQLRFEQLCRIITPTDKFSISDLGCGYGALYDYLAQRYPEFEYSGFDISESLIESAEQLYGNAANARFVLASTPSPRADYCVASGIFNVRFNRSDSEWRDYLYATLETMDRSSNLGFAFNCLTSYSDADRMRDDLYYADPCAVFDYCKREYSKNVALLHDYGLYEFTLLVRKKL